MTIHEELASFNEEFADGLEKKIQNVWRISTPKTPFF